MTSAGGASVPPASQVLIFFIAPRILRRAAYEKEIMSDKDGGYI
jgi:hypothetical protein